MSFATKRIGPPCCTLVTFVTFYPLRIILSQNYLLPIISVLVENTLPKTAYHFLLLLVGFDTLTYRKDYDRSPILVGHEGSMATVERMTPQVVLRGRARKGACLLGSATSARARGWLLQPANYPKSNVVSHRTYSDVMAMP